MGLPLGMCVGDWGVGGRPFSCLLAQKAGLTPPASAASSFQVSFLGPPPPHALFQTVILPTLPTLSHNLSGWTDMHSASSQSSFLPLRSLLTCHLFGKAAPVACT